MSYPLDYEKIIARFPACRVAVIGDVMLDEYVWGRVSRISPEAPVPVVLENSYSCCLGGAANAMRNIATLGGECLAFGAVGDDMAGGAIRSQLRKEYGIDDRFILIEPGRTTTSKRRIVAGTQQLLRVDREDTGAYSDAVREELVRGVIEAIETGAVDAVIFEDYAKGLLSESMVLRIVAAAMERNLITAMDPKPGHLVPIPGLSMLKPNRQEALAMTGLPANTPLPKIAEKLLKEWHCQYLLISLSAEGMALCRADQPPTVIPTVAREVFDVSGAGDTVTATFVLALAAGADAEQAAHLANAAAGKVVAALGTATVKASELNEMMHECVQRRMEKKG